MSDWEFFTRRQIEDAQDDGSFDAPEYHGKPLDLTENPFVPEDQRMAYKIMKDNGVVPGWIGDGKEITDTINTARTSLARSYTAFQETLRKLESRVDIEAIYARDAAYHNWDTTCERFRREGAKINKLIETYNLRVPISELQRLYFNIEREIDALPSKGSSHA